MISAKYYVYRGIAVFCSVLLVAVLTWAAIRRETDPDVLESRKRYETRRWELKEQYLQRNFQMTHYGTLAVIGAICLAVVVVAVGNHRAKVQKASVFLVKIGKAEFPVHIKQIEKGTLQEEIKILAHADELKQSNKGLEKAWEIHVALAELETQRIRALASSYKMQSQTALPAPAQEALPLPAYTMSDLLQQGTLAPGKPIPFGHIQTPPDEIVSLGIGGWQGSGKTLTMAYLTGAVMLSADADAYVIDPHRDHPKGLAPILKPLETTGRLHILSPFDVQALIDRLDALLDDRLSGRAPSSPAIVLVIDELPRLSHFPVFERLTAFLVRCITETRKANMTFIGGSHIWTAKYFNGHAEIRQCLNSMLILPMKSSQAELLLEDTQEKKMVKALDEPGKGILSLNMQPTQIVKMPKCTPADMQTIADRLPERAPVIDIDASKPLTKEEIAAGRKRLHLSQADFGAKVGLSQKQISRLENGEIDIQSIDIDVLDKIVDTIDPLDDMKSNIIDFRAKAHA